MRIFYSKYHKNNTLLKEILQDDQHKIIMGTTF